MHIQERQINMQTTVPHCLNHDCRYRETSTNNGDLPIDLHIKRSFYCNEGAKAINAFSVWKVVSFGNSEWKRLWPLFTIRRILVCNICVLWSLRVQVISSLTKAHCQYNCAINHNRSVEITTSGWYEAAFWIRTVLLVIRLAHCSESDNAYFDRIE